ncbi:probable LRR receptor-like serine/threonine-protein kinase MEE39 [Hevea brasiliensis]|uniref:probable LRR receptor-like serine/threonine-protein kinase MEE39 n=1 Tax=Hevea brasiliensis TaxID=3981 RepID=UPI0025D5AFD1|nr:probable LRR receptor-like serine/threonine-protein kinase MEE39 [Hevea brasiliensis]
MKKISWIQLVFCVFIQLQNTSSHDPNTWLNIDCGIEAPRVGPNLLSWNMDHQFTQSGINKRLPEKQPLDEMTTLRFFPNRMDQNCYTIPAYKRTLQYIIRAGFYYGNYDGLSKPPSFDLYLDGQLWSTVKTSTIGGPIYVEAIYVTHGSGSIGVCLIQTRDGEIPFISSLEAMPLWTHLYSQMENNSTFTLVNRTNLGGNEIRYTGLFSDEKYNRIWTSGAIPQNCKPVPTLPDSTTATLENDPPKLVLQDSIVSNTSDPIILTVDNPPNWTSRTAYLVLYFTEMATRPTLNDTRIMDIEINRQKMYTVGAEINQCKVVTLYPVPLVGPTINIKLASSRLSTLPPMISAMEVFTRANYNPPPSSAAAPGTKPTSGAWKNFFVPCTVFFYISCAIAFF